MPSVSSSSRPKVLLSSTVMTPSLPTLSIASAMSSPMAGSAAEIDAVAAICSLVSTSLAVERRYSLTASTAFSMPFFRAIGLAPAATLRRPSRTSAWASTVAVVVPSPATSSVFLATSLTSSAPIFSQGSSSSISLAMLTPSLVMVGAPHFFSRTTLRPRGPRVTLTASARVFMPRSRPRRASSSKAIILAMWVVSSMHGSLHGRAAPATDDTCRMGTPSAHGPVPHRSDHDWHSETPSARKESGTRGLRVQEGGLGDAWEREGGDMTPERCRLAATYLAAGWSPPHRWDVVRTELVHVDRRAQPAFVRRLLEDFVNPARLPVRRPDGDCAAARRRAPRGVDLLGFALPSSTPGRTSTGGCARPSQSCTSPVRKVADGGATPSLPQHATRPGSPKGTGPRCREVRRNARRRPADPSRPGRPRR